MPEIAEVQDICSVLWAGSDLKDFTTPIVSAFDDDLGAVFLWIGQLASLRNPAFRKFSSDLLSCTKLEQVKSVVKLQLECDEAPEIKDDHEAKLHDILFPYWKGGDFGVLAKDEIEDRDALTLYFYGLAIPQSEAWEKAILYLVSKRISHVCVVVVLDREAIEKAW